MNHRQIALMLALPGVPFLMSSCSKSNEVAHTTPAQNAAMTNLDVIATAHAKADNVEAPAPAR